MKAYLYIEDAKLREVHYQANEVWAMHMGHTFRVRRLHFGSGASVFPAMAPDYVVPIEAGPPLPCTSPARLSIRAARCPRSIARPSPSN